MDEPAAPPPPTRARRRARPVTIVVLVLLPWTWYLWRNLSGGINFFSVAIPLLVALVTGIFVFAAIAARRWWPLIVAASLLLFGVSAVALPRTPQSSPTPVDPFRIASANVYDGNRDPGDAATAIAGTGAEVLIAVETPNLFQDELAAAAGPSYRYGYAGPWFAVRSMFPVQPLTDPGRPSRARGRGPSRLPTRRSGAHGLRRARAEPGLRDVVQRAAGLHRGSRVGGRAGASLGTGRRSPAISTCPIVPTAIGS